MKQTVVHFYGTISILFGFIDLQNQKWRWHIQHQQRLVTSQMTSRLPRMRIPLGRVQREDRWITSSGEVLQPWSTLNLHIITMTTNKYHHVITVNICSQITLHQVLLKKDSKWIKFTLSFRCHLCSTWSTNLFQLTRDIDPLLIQYWASIADGWPTLKEQWINVAY